MARDARVKLIEQPKREGKTSAINLFLAAAQGEICVLESGDTIPHEYAVEHLVRMFTDETVGMVGAQKMAVNTPEHIVGLLSHLRLRMEHELCLEIPRLGEMIAFRKLFDQIPYDVAMDEAFVEAIVVKAGMSVRYAPDAIVYNTGPDNIADFVRQRRRNHAGHLYLKHKYGYAVSSIQNGRVARIAFKEVIGVIKLLWVLFLLAVVEAWSRLLGWYDFAIKRDRHVVWDMAWSQKQDVQDVRRNHQTSPQSSPSSAPVSPSPAVYAPAAYAPAGVARMGNDVSNNMIDDRPDQSLPAAQA
jgi:cellulose synthase/poly-beta-1,6-N-acetylglucosamine synthase-like glycosyltransferase